jgi:EAL domain-containing protein (putative c-di-GMP-specific phosphodiesterase class I)
MQDANQADAGSKGSVLLIDDEPQVLSTYSRVLCRAGFSVETLADGRGVPAALESKDFDVIVSDVGLPGMSGIDVLRAAHRRDPDLPVVLMTAGGDLSSVTQAIEHGALRYLLKPVQPHVLSEAAEEAVRLRQIAKVKHRAFDLYGKLAKEEADRAELASRFDAALASLHMAYQPIVRWSDRSVLAYEALVRTREPSLKRPDDLFAVAERLDRIHELGRCIRRSVATTMRSASPPVSVFVNLHPLDLGDDELLAAASPLAEFSEDVVLEVTERASLEGVSDVRARIATLRKLGYRLAIDDLGAGYAGLSSFAQIQPEVVKLDMSLTRNVHLEQTKQKLVRTMTSLCSDLDMLVVAEGVETADERDMLATLGCDVFQGYLFAKPGEPFPQATFG